MLFPKCPCCAALAATIRKLAVSDGDEQWHNNRGDDRSCRSVFVALGGYMYGEVLLDSAGGRAGDDATLIRWDDDDGSKTLESEGLVEAFDAENQQGTGTLPCGREFAIKNGSLYWSLGAIADGTQYVQTYDAETLEGEFATPLEGGSSFRGIAPDGTGAIVLRGSTELRSVDSAHNHVAWQSRILCDVGRFDWIDVDGNITASLEWAADVLPAIINAVCGRDGRGYHLAAQAVIPHTSHTLGQLVLGAALRIIDNTGSLVGEYAITSAWLFRFGPKGQGMQGQILADDTGLFVLCGTGDVDATGHTFDGSALLVRLDLDGAEEWRWKDPDEPAPYKRANNFIPDFAGGVLEYGRAASNALRRISGGAVLWEAAFDDNRAYSFVAKQCVPDGDHFYVVGQGRETASGERFQVLKINQIDGQIEWAALHDINGRFLLDAVVEGDYVYVVGEPGRTEEEDEP